MSFRIKSFLQNRMVCIIGAGVPRPTENRTCTAHRAHNKPIMPINKARMRFITPYTNFGR